MTRFFVRLPVCDTPEEALADLPDEARVVLHPCFAGVVGVAELPAPQPTTGES